MDASELKRLAEAVAAGAATPDELVERVRADAARSVADLGYAQVDTQRGLRTGVSEVVYGAGKTAEQIAGILQAMHEAGQRRVLVTRFAPEKAAQVARLLGVELVSAEAGDKKSAAPASAAASGAAADAPPAPGPEAARASSSVPGGPVRYWPSAQLAVRGEMPVPDGNGRVVVAAAGTSDYAVAEEAALTAEFLGNRVTRLYDVGVAGIHRLLAHVDDLASAQVVVAVAGMEGALASVVGGLAACPVIAVPTSVGYGASFGGVAALLAMLNSCASGVSVVNIDNGFGAGYQASLINHARIRS